MKRLESRPFRPYISLEQIYAFDKERPETHTVSPLVNAVLEAFSDPRLRLGTAMARYFHLDARSMSGALQIATGFGLCELRRLWTLNEAEKFMAKNPKCSQEELARALGYQSRNSLWQAINADRINRSKAEERKRVRAWTHEDWDDYFRRREEGRKRTQEFLERFRREGKIK